MCWNCTGCRDLAARNVMLMDGVEARYDCKVAYPIAPRPLYSAKMWRKFISHVREGPGYRALKHVKMILRPR